MKQGAGRLDELSWLDDNFLSGVGIYSIHSDGQSRCSAGFLIVCHVSIVGVH